MAAAFYAAYTLQDQLTVLEQTRKLNQDQVDLLDHWVDIGRSRPSEVLSAQTQLASIDAQIEDTRRTHRGKPASSLLFNRRPGGCTPGRIPRLRRRLFPWRKPLTKAGQRPELLPQSEALYQADLSIRYPARRPPAYIGLTAHSYTERTGFLSDVRWDATFLFDVPLFEGGSTQALVRQARAQEIIAQLTFARLKRDINRQVQTAYDDLRHAVSEVQAYDKAVKLAEKNYEVQQKEYRLGVTTNLELLQLIGQLAEFLGQWLVSRANARLDDVLLRVAMGEGL